MESNADTLALEAKRTKLDESNSNILVVKIDPVMSANESQKQVATNITYQKSMIDKLDRMDTFVNRNQTGCTIWFTGLSCSGKTTISFALEEYLVKKRQISTYTLDGDNIRHGLNSNLGFTPEDRTENIRRIGEVSKLFADSGLVCLSSFISPYYADRQRVREIHEKSKLPFIEVYVKAPLEVCESRDVKGLYKKARSGLIKDFTAIHSKYEEPPSPEIVLETSKFTIDECIQKIIDYLEQNELIQSKTNLADLKNRELFLNEENLDQLKTECLEYYQLNINLIELQWLQVLSEGWAHPLRGFMNEDDYLQTLHFNCIKRNGKVINQSVPIVLSCNETDKQNLADKKEVTLKYNGKIVGFMTNLSIFPHRKEERCARQFGLVHRGHPYQKYIFEECGDWLIGGDLHVFERVKWEDGLDQYRLTPYELNKKFSEIKADAIFAFQLRNPIHNGHALLMKDTRRFLLEKGYKNPVLLLHPLGGWTKDDDAPLPVRIEQHKAVLEDGNYLDAESTIMAIFPSPMMYAGPTEVQWHAKTRMNAGANFYIVGRDPAGMPHPDTKQDIYDATHGARVLQMAPGLEQLKIVPFKVAAYNKILNKMDYFDPKNAGNFEFISGTKMRKLARDGELPPDGFMVNKAWNILADYYKNLKQQ
ncbi:unnamed protein product [Brachionus calyciflorus]|uniref:Uncharacterized protein n=1 Tax=Brachionus calyciflorus TaxID=104777 RepID=A0A813VP21_9BILA|nr:unnamed protein product [Brachionus calyciflorus]